MNLPRNLRIALVVLATVASLAVTVSGLPVAAKSIADALLVVLSALGIVPLHLDVVDGESQK